MRSPRYVIGIYESVDGQLTAKAPLYPEEIGTWHYHERDRVEFEIFLARGITMQDAWPFVDGEINRILAKRAKAFPSLNRLTAETCDI